LNGGRYGNRRVLIEIQGIILMRGTFIFLISQC
jgi:hypothetical protein